MAGKTHENIKTSLETLIVSPIYMSTVGAASVANMRTVVIKLNSLDIIIHLFLLESNVV